jgi:hypothetical protein
VPGSVPGRPVWLRNHACEVSYGSYMTTSRRPVRRLPARIYWFRRSLVLATALAMVFAVARLLGSGGGDPGSATPAAADLGGSTATANAGPLGPRPLNGSKATATGKPPPTALAQPDGPCALDEITVTPVMGSAVAGAQVGLTLELTGTRPACTFDVSSGSLVAKVVHGDTRIWTSQQCRRSVPKQSVVVRSALATTVQVNWSGRRSDDKCSRAAGWAFPGHYRVVAAVVGSEPGEAAFQLKSPPRPVVTKTIQPKKVRTTTPTATANSGR